MDKVVHFEIPADDLGRAKEFYSRVFGWKIEKAPVPGVDYYMVYTTEVDPRHMPKTPGAINGGMTARVTPGETPVIVVNVKSVDQALEMVKKAGGKVAMPKIDMANMGFSARVSDTEGNVIGVWEEVGR